MAAERFLRQGAQRSMVMSPETTSAALFGRSSAARSRPGRRASSPSPTPRSRLPDSRGWFVPRATDVTRGAMPAGSSPSLGELRDQLGALPFQFVGGEQGVQHDVGQDVDRPGGNSASAPPSSHCCCRRRWPWRRRPETGDVVGNRSALREAVPSSSIAAVSLAWPASAGFECCRS